jgi:hypothetical protein
LGLGSAKTQARTRATAWNIDIYTTRYYTSAPDSPVTNGFLEFVWLPTFESSAAGLLNDSDLRELELALVENPERGAAIRGTGGFRKLRWPARGKGKRGGARVVYYYVASREVVYMLLAYGKGTKDDLTDTERSELRELARRIKRGRG